MMKSSLHKEAQLFHWCYMFEHDWLCFLVKLQRRNTEHFFIWVKWCVFSWKVGIFWSSSSMRPTHTYTCQHSWQGPPKTAAQSHDIVDASKWMSSTQAHLNSHSTLPSEFLQCPFRLICDDQCICHTDEVASAIAISHSLHVWHKGTPYKHWFTGRTADVGLTSAVGCCRAENKRDFLSLCA